MAFAIVLLILNLREVHNFEFGTLQTPGPANNLSVDDNAFQRVFPDLKFVHACSACGECVHPFEVVENRRVMSIHDHNGWYRLFRAADQEYYYGDPIHMLADWGGNRTAELPRGRWTLRLHAGPATHRAAPAHECGSIPGEISLAYDLVVSDDPLEESFHSGDGPLKVLQSFSWLVTNPGRQMSLGWRLAGAPHIGATACPCARP
jgi:hypothetical protein